MNNHYTTESSPDGEERENGGMGRGDELLQPKRERGDREDRYMTKRWGKYEMLKEVDRRTEGGRDRKSREKDATTKLKCPSTRV